MGNQTGSSVSINPKQVTPGGPSDHPPPPSSSNISQEDVKLDDEPTFEIVPRMEDDFAPDEDVKMSELKPTPNGDTNHTIPGGDGAESTKHANWAMQLTQQEVSNIKEEYQHFYGSLKCCICESTPLDEDDNTEGFVECEGCITEDRYFCSDCKRAARKKHKKMDHEFQPKQVPAEIIMQAKHSLQLVEGRANVSTFLEKDKSNRFQETLDTVIAGSKGALMTVAPSAAEGSMALFNASAKAAIKKLSLKDLAARITQQPELTRYLGAGLAVSVCGLEIMTATRRYLKNPDENKSWKILGRDIGQSINKNLSVYAGGIHGFKAGATLGGFVGPIGALVGGFIGSVLGSVLAQKAQAYVFLKIWPDMEHNQRQKFINEALIAFQFCAEDVKNPEIFNEAEIRKRYRSRARETHPDTRTGSHQKFLVLQTYFGALMTLLDEANGKEISEERLGQIVKAITLG